MKISRNINTQDVLYGIVLLALLYGVFQVAKAIVMVLAGVAFFVFISKNVVVKKGTNEKEGH